MVNPFCMKVDGTFTRITRDDHDYLSQFVVTIATGLITVHFGQEHVLCLKMIMEHVLEFYKVYLCCHYRLKVMVHLLGLVSVEHFVYNSIDY